MATEGGIVHPTIVCGIIVYFNEKDNLDPLVRELYKTFEGRPERLRLVLVDDGSVDGSYEVATALQAEFFGIALLRFSRNFGHHTALIAGIKHAQGDLFFLMDCDFQDDPSLVPHLMTRSPPISRSSTQSETSEWKIGGGEWRRASTGGW